MKIMLVSPRMSLRPMDSDYKRRMSPSLALLTLAALTPKEHRVAIEDENVRPLRVPERVDLAGITVNVDTSARAYAIAAQFRARGVPVILGGIHASAVPEEALRHADAVCVGEAEEVWASVLEDAQHGALKPVYRSERPIDPASIPPLRWEMLDASKYLCTNLVCASRGCPFACEFCYNTCAYARHLCQARPVENVIDEILRLRSNHFMFVDDNLIGDLPWARKLVAALAPLGLTWHAAVSANIGSHPDLLDAMRDAGCRSLFIGFESINPESLRDAHKRQNTVSGYDALMAAIHERGIMVNASLVFGFDHDGPDVFPRTLEWLVRNKVETMTAHILTPYPGTRLYDRLKKEGRILDSDATHYNTAHVVFQPKGMSPEELVQGYTGLYRDFYSFANIARRLPADRATWPAYLFFNLGYRKFGKWTSRFAHVVSMRRITAFATRVSYGSAWNAASSHRPVASNYRVGTIH